MVILPCDTIEYFVSSGASFYFGKNAPSVGVFPELAIDCVAANEVMRFSVRGFGCALFIF